MTLVPLLMDLTHEFEDLEREFDDDFAFGIYPHEIITRFRRPSRLQLLAHPRKRLVPYTNTVARRPTAGAVAVKENKTADDHCVVGKNGFQVCMDVQQFKPNELVVKTSDNSIIIEGKHEEREDGHGIISRNFVRKYTLPKGFDTKDVVSTLSSDGVLTVKAPPPAKGEESNERVVQIQQTGPAHLNVKDNPKEAVENGDKSNEKMED